MRNSIPNYIAESLCPHALHTDQEQRFGTPATDHALGYRHTGEITAAQYSCYTCAHDEMLAVDGLGNRRFSGLR